MSAIDQDDIKELLELKGLVQEFFSILNVKEESDNGRVFHPVYISSCRVLESEKLRRILPRMEELATPIK